MGKSCAATVEPAYFQLFFEVAEETCVLKVDVDAHQPGTMAAPGAAVSETDETNPMNLLVGVNDDNDDGGPAGSKDNSDTTIGSNDNDIVKAVLASPGVSVGTMEFTVTPASKVQVFIQYALPVSGTRLVDCLFVAPSDSLLCSVNLASSTGDLAGLVSPGGVDLYLEGMASAADVTLRLVYKNGAGPQVADEAHFGVVAAGLTATDLDGVVVDASEETTGAYVHWNVDNDDASDNAAGAPKRPGADYLQTGAGKVTGDDDLKSLTMAVSPDLSKGFVVLNVNNTRAKIWKDAEKGSANLVLAGPGDKSWNLGDAGQKAEFLSLRSSLWVEGVDAGTSVVKLSYKNALGTEISSDKITYTFIAADCGRQPGTSPPSERDSLKGVFPNLVHGEWSVTDEATQAYNCIAWSVGESNSWYNKADIDFYYGNHDGIFDISDMDAFYLAKKGWHPTASGAADAEAMYFSEYHGAKKKGCASGSGRWIMFESKCGNWVRMEHVWDQLNGSTYGTPIRFYK